jgi:hypothetical protein
MKRLWLRNEQPISLQWQISRNGGNTYTDIEGETGDTLVFTGATVPLPGMPPRLMFRCVATNEYGRATSNIARLTVNPAPSPTPIPATAPVDRRSSVTLWPGSTGVEFSERNIPGAAGRTVFVRLTNDIAGLTGSVTVYDSKNNVVRNQGITSGNLEFQAVPGETYRVRFLINNNTGRVRDFNYRIYSLV